MNAIRLSVRMALRRRTAAFLAVMFTWAATVFLLAYPSLIEQAQAQLDHAYDTLPVEGWIVNAAGYDAPAIPGEVWKPLAETGLLRSYQAQAAVRSDIAYAHILEQVYREAYPGAEGPPPEGLAPALLSVAIHVDNGADSGSILGINKIESEKNLNRMAGQIVWAEGYGPDCLTGSEPVCLLPEQTGYAPGDSLPVRLYYSNDIDESRYYQVILKVAGIYPAHTMAQVVGYCPLAALEEIWKEADWELSLSSFTFTPADNRRLPELKAVLREMNLSGTGEDAKLRAAIDDRVLQGTVAPIKSNLGLLKGLYGLFFGAVALIGFFICFLQAKGRKSDYAVMRLLGESSGSITAKALLEQAALCVAGVILGAALLAVTGKAAVSPLVCAGVLACYTLGAGVAVGLTVRVNVMEILRDKE